MTGKNARKKWSITFSQGMLWKYSLKTISEMLLIEKETITVDRNLFIIHKPTCRKKFKPNFKRSTNFFVPFEVCGIECLSKCLQTLVFLFSLCFLSLLIWRDIDSQTSTNQVLLKGKVIRENNTKSMTMCWYREFNFSARANQEFSSSSWSGWWWTQLLVSGVVTYLHIGNSQELWP